MKTRESVSHSSRSIIGVLLVMALALGLSLGLSGCKKGGSEGASSDYDSQKIVVEFPDESTKEITIGELRGLPQKDLAAQYRRSTGTEESYDMQGPLLKDVLNKVGANIDDYEGVSVGGSDGYYTMLSREVISATPDLLLAVKVDGKDELKKGVAPAQLAVQGQIGPYWVKMVDRIVLYDEVPQKDIKNVWVFNNLTKDLEPHMYKYFGSEDKAFNLQEVWPLLDNVDSKAFFTMKSSDGYMRNESLGSVQKNYFIKTEGKDAPINVSPNIDPTFGVKTIAWVSSNEDAMIFPEQLEKYVTTATIDGKKGIVLDELLYEVQADKVKDNNFEVIGMDGTSVPITGAELNKAILVPGDGTYTVIFDPALGKAPVENMLEIKRVD